VFIDDHVPSVDADAELNTSIRGNGGIMIGQRVLDFEPTTYSVYSAVKLRQKTVSLDPD
jgi:hypothetical protein